MIFEARLSDRTVLPPFSEKGGLLNIFGKKQRATKHYREAAAYLLLELFQKIPNLDYLSVYVDSERVADFGKLINLSEWDNFLKNFKSTFETYKEIKLIGGIFHPNLVHLTFEVQAENFSGPEFDISGIITGDPQIPSKADPENFFEELKKEAATGYLTNAETVFSNSVYEFLLSLSKLGFGLFAEATQETKMNIPVFDQDKKLWLSRILHPEKRRAIDKNVRNFRGRGYYDPDFLDNEMDFIWWYVMYLYFVDNMKSPECTYFDQQGLPINEDDAFRTVDEAVKEAGNMDTGLLNPAPVE
jgi:hypothetical protein